MDGDLFGKTTAVAVGAALTTSLDELVLLTVYFAEVAAQASLPGGGDFRAMHVVAGVNIGFTVLVCIAYIKMCFCRRRPSSSSSSQQQDCGGPGRGRGGAVASATAAGGRRRGGKGGDEEEERQTTNTTGSDETADLTEAGGGAVVATTLTSSSGGGGDMELVVVQEDQRMATQGSQRQQRQEEEEKEEEEDEEEDQGEEAPLSPSPGTRQRRYNYHRPAAPPPREQQPRPPQHTAAAAAAAGGLSSPSSSSGEGGWCGRVRRVAEMIMHPSVVKVSATIIGDGGDTLSIYVPLFATSNGARIALLLMVSYVTLALWCVLAYCLVRLHVVSRVIERWGALLVPAMLIGLGVYVLVENDTLELVT